MSGARGGGVPESSETKWLAFAVLMGVIGLAVWFAARWLIVIPLLAWAAINYAALDAAGLLDEAGRAWRDYASTAWSALMEGRLASTDLDWGVHLLPLHQDVSGRVLWLWLPVFMIMTLFILFRSRGGGFKRRFLLTGMRKQSVVRFLGMKCGGLVKGLLSLLTTLTLTRRLVMSERKEWVMSGPSFLSYQGLHWKTTSIANRFRPDGTGLPEPALTPVEWVLRHVKPKGDGALPIMTREQFLAACREAMKTQLGSPWNGLAKAKPHVRAIMALAFLNRVKGDKASREFAEKLALVCLSTPPGDKRAKGLDRVAASVLADRKAVARIEKWASGHAWTNTAAIAVFAKGGPFQAWGGGDAGVLPSSSVLWLKEMDRPLWYALNNVGRRAFHVEGAGAVCHFFHERAAGRLLDEPMVDEAIVGSVDSDSSGRLHGILGYLRDNQMLPEPNVVDFALIERVLRREED